MKKRLYIIGARAFGRELAVSLPTWNGFLDKYTIKGFLDDKVDALDGYAGYPPIVSSAELFSPKSNDVVVCGLGAVKWRTKYIRILLEKGAKFETLISPEAFVAKTATIGMGTVISGDTSVSADVHIGNFVLCHPHCSFGHDTIVGDGAVIENGVFCGGWVQVGERATLHTRATVLPRQKIGADAIVGACSCVIRSVKAGTTVFGVPARCVD